MKPKPIEYLNGKITRFSCSFNRLFMVLIHGFSCRKTHEKRIKNPMKILLKPP